jgi:hypothetical protein
MAALTLILLMEEEVAVDLHVVQEEVEASINQEEGEDLQVQVEMAHKGVG